MQRRADLKGGMDRFTIGLFQYTAFFVFLFLLCVISWKLLSDEPSHGNNMTYMLTSSSANLVVTYKKAI